MNYLLLSGIVVAGVVYHFIPKKGTAAKKMQKARALFEEGEIIKLNQMLDEIIVFSISGKYKADYIEHLLEALDFLKDICKEQNINKDNLIDPVFSALKEIQLTGGIVNTDITDPLENWLNEMAKSEDVQVGQLLKDAQTSDILTLDESYIDFTSELIDPVEIKIINTAGSFMLKRKFKEGIDFLDSHMPDCMSAFKANLMDQKAAMHFMDGQIDKVAELYREILKHYPDNNRIKTSLAEAYVELKKTEEATRVAKEVLASTADKDSRKTCLKIVKRYNK